jgi:hypothetical protein
MAKEGPKTADPDPANFAAKGEGLMHNVYLAVGAAGLAAWIFGAIYYGVLGKAWQRAQGLDPEACKGKKMPVAPLVGSLVAALVMAFTLRTILGWLGLHTWQDGLVTGLTVGIGFVATTLTVNNMFQQRQPMLTVIDTGHWLGALMIEGVVLMLLA